MFWNALRCRKMLLWKQIKAQYGVVCAHSQFLLIDSGGHYLDMGTTDVTRTVYLGDNITPYQKECFTRVLKGHIQLGS